MSRGLRVARNMAVIILAPIAFLVLLEGALRLARVGYPAEFWVETPDGEAVQTNRLFGRRFFPEGLARMPEPVRLAVPKGTGVYRIFVIGESAAMGFPEPGLSFGRLLEILLEERFPKIDFEIVNAAMTAINSHVSRVIVRDSAQYEPDAFVVYLGNNEVVGPYGPGTVFGGEAPSPMFLRPAIALGGTRAGQLLTRVTAAWSRSETPESWRGMEMFVEREVAADDPRLTRVYESFEANLRSIRRAAKSADARLLLSTMVVNLRDSPPFASKGDETSAPEEWEEGLVRTPSRADLHFAKARALISLGRAEEARESLERARDLDRLRFRADGRINETIRKVAAEDNAIELVDAETAFADVSDGGAPGNEWFYEHVHFRFRGNWKLAMTAAEVLVTGLPSKIRESEPPDSWLSETEAAERVGLSTWELSRMQSQITDLMERPPFTGQLGHDERIRRLRMETVQLNLAANPGEARARLKKALERRPNDTSLLRRAAEAEAAAGQFPDSAKLWAQLLDVLPERPDWLAAQGTALFESGRQAEAKEVFLAALEQDSQLAEVELGLGAVALRAGDRAEAERRYRRALQIDPDYAEAENNLGSLRLEEGDFAGALKHFEKAKAKRPRYTTALANEGVALLRLGRTDEALEAFAAAAHSNPASAKAEFQWASAAAALGRFDEAGVHFERTLRLEPDHAEAVAGLGAVSAMRGDVTRATELYRKAVSLRPDLAAAQFNLGKLLEMRGDLQGAIGSYRAATAARPNYAEALNNLGIVLARSGAREEAVEAFEKALAAAPGFAAARENLERLRGQ